jgi:glycosyltransferase involved in cell wall biosynthesis
VSVPGQPSVAGREPRPSGTRPRRVLFVAGAAFFSGAERALLLTIRALDPERYRPFVVVGEDGEFRAQLAAAGIQSAHVRLALTDWRHPVAWAGAVLRVAAVARRVGASVVHANEAPSFHCAGYAARLLGIPAVCHVRFPDTALPWFLKPGFARTVFVSNDLLENARANCPGLFDGRSEVIHDGVLLPALPPAEERRARRAALGLPADEPIVLFAGQIAEIKGIWEYVEAARILIAGGSRATFAVMGDDLRGGGALRRLVEKKVSEIGLEPRFRFLGFRRDAPELIPLFDIAAVPSHVEPLGNATLEAMAAALPVVGSRVGGIPEMIAHGETGLLIPPRDPQSLASALERLIGDAPLRARLGAAGRRRAEVEFGLEAHARRIQEVYDRLLEGDRVRRTELPP